MGRITDDCADSIANSPQKITIPHPTRKGFLIVGWVVPEDNVKIGIASLALSEIAKWWTTSRSFKVR